jgi:hypothetical protein
MIFDLVPSLSAPTTSNISAAVNTFYWLDISGLVNNIDVVLPTTPATGDMIAVGLSVGDNTYKVNLKSGAAGDLIDGTDYSSTPWSALFRTGEVVVFRCVSGATADWVVDSDARKPCYCHVKPSADVTTNSLNAFQDFNFDSEVTDVGDVYSTGTNLLTTRRAGVWALVVHYSPWGATTSYNRKLRLNSKTEDQITVGYDHFPSIQLILPAEVLADGATLNPEVWCGGNTGIGWNASRTFFMAREVLR